MKQTTTSWLTFSAMAVSFCMTMLDVTVLPVALPTIQQKLHISNLALQWSVNSYNLALSLFVLAGGHLGDLLGFRKTFCAGLMLFTLSSLFCGVAQSAATLIFFRFTQGIGGALLIPSSNSILISSLPPQGQGRMMGLYTSCGTFFLAIGPFLGGLLTQYTSWRLIFFLNAPLALLSYALTLTAVPHKKGYKGSFDWKGFFLTSSGLVLILLPLAHVKFLIEHPWRPAVLILAGCTLLSQTSHLTRTIHPKPYLPLFLLRKPPVLAASLSIFMTSSILTLTVLWSIHFQNIFSYTPAEAGGLSLLSNLPLLLAAPLAGALADKHGTYYPISAGFLLMSGSLLWLNQIVHTPTPLSILSAIIPFGIGVSLILTPAYTAVLGSFSEKYLGVVSGMTTMVKQLGNTIGFTLFSTLYSYATQTLLVAQISQQDSLKKISSKQLDGALSHLHTITQKLHLSLSETLLLKKYAINAAQRAFTALNNTAALLSILGFAIVCYMMKKKLK